MSPDSLYLEFRPLKARQGFGCQGVAISGNWPFGLVHSVLRQTNDLHASTVRGDQDVKRETNMYPKGSQYRLLGYTALCQFAHSTSNWIQAKSKCSNVRKADTASAKAPCECTKEHQPVGVVIVPAKATSPWALAWNHCKIRHQPCL